MTVGSERTPPRCRATIGDNVDKSQFYPFRKHSGYFNEGSKALDDISRVIAGRGKK